MMRALRMLCGAAVMGAAVAIAPAVVVLGAIVSDAAGAAETDGSRAKTNRSPGAPGFDVRPVADGVYAVIRREPLGLANHANDLFIIGDENVIVVDAAFTLEATVEVRDALRRLTDKPVRWVVTTHWHDDHTFGNQVWREAYPGVEFIAQARTAEDLAGVAVENRKGQVEGGPGALESFREMLAAGKRASGEPLSADERAAYESTIAIAQRYLDEMPRFVMVPPTVTFTDSLTLHQGNRIVQILHPGLGVTRGDAVVYLPAEDVLAAGDLVDHPFPFAYGSHVAAWIESLERLEALQPRIIVPGHGPVLSGTSHLRTLEALLTSVRDQTRDARARGRTVEQAQAEVHLDDFRGALGAERGMGRYLFDSLFMRPAVAAAYRDTAAAM